MSKCKIFTKKLCSEDACSICYNKSFASYKGLTKKGKRKVDCWDYEINKISPREIYKGCNKKFAFICDVCDHSFSTIINSITSIGRENWCPYCAIPVQKLCEECDHCYNKSFASYEGLTIKGKRKVDCWNYDVNQISPKSIGKSCNKKFAFICDVCDHSFSSSINSISRKDGNWCPYCSVLVRDFCDNKECDLCYNNSFASYKDKTPIGKLKVECWDYENNKNTPRYIAYGTRKKFQFICDVCDHFFSSAIDSITKNGSWCPYCSIPVNKMCDSKECVHCYNNSFASYEGLTPTGEKKIDCWHSSNKVTPRDIFICSGSKFKFICDVCDHIFDKRISDITSSNSWCPYCCYGPKICDSKECEHCFNNSFASYEGITKSGKKKVDCWHKDNKITPRDIAKSCNKKFKFMCDTCDHTFNTAISNITSKSPIWCPYCSTPAKKKCNKECKHCFNNSFASYKGLTVTGKKKVDCWHNSNKVTPRDIAKCCNKKFKFICDVCDHTFNKRISDITLSNSWCPYCKNKTESTFKHWFEKKYSDLTLKYQPKYKWCKNPETNKYLPFDFVVEETKTIFEIDGEQHFTQVSNWRSADIQLEVDKLKMDFALKQGYSIIRILQEDIWFDKNRWEDKFVEAFTTYEEPNVICIGCEEKYSKHIT